MVFIAPKHEGAKRPEQRDIIASTVGGAVRQLVITFTLDNTYIINKLPCHLT